MLNKSPFLLTLVLLLASFLPAGAAAQAKLPESPIKTIYITPLSHYDFGFVEPPDAVRERAARHIDEVIRVAREDPNFRWTIESVWQVEEWLKRQRKPTSVLPKDRERIAVLMNLIKSGQIALSTSWGSMHTDFMGAEEMNRLCYAYAGLARRYGIKSELAMMDDVPGHPSSIPSVLAGSGTKYLVVGANLFINQATSLAPGKVPFYWESPDGSKVLLWVSQSNRGGYTEGLTDYYLDPFSLDPYTDKTPFDMFNPGQAGKKSPLEVQEIGVTALLNRYNKAGYKYDAVMAMYAHDFIEPTDVLNLERAVKLWNSNHEEVKLKISTPDVFLKYIQNKYGNEIPTYKGEWSGLWSEAKTQSPRISAMARFTHDQAPAAETLWSALSMTRGLPFPEGNFSDVYDLVLTYDEHSGAGNNGWIQLNDRHALEEQNRQYVRFMKKSSGELKYMLDRGLFTAAQPDRYANPKKEARDARKLIVYNGLSWERTDVVSIPAPGKGKRVAAITDPSDGSQVAFRPVADGGAVFVAENVPSLGYKSYLITTGQGTGPARPGFSQGNTIENDRFRVSVAADGNIESIFDKVLGRDLVDSTGPKKFNELLRVEGSEGSKVFYPVAPSVRIEKGDVVSRIVIERPRSVFPKTVISLFKGVGRVGIRNELDPHRFPFVGGSENWHDSYYFAFPLAVPPDGLKVKRGGQKWFDTLPDDYLPGARRDSVTTQHLIGMTNGSRSALIAHRQSFYWLFPGYVDTDIRPKDAAKGFPAMFTGKWPLPEAILYSRAIRESDQADTHDLRVINMETVEPGLKGDLVFDYAIAGENAFDDVRAWRMGSDFNVPLWPVYTDFYPDTKQRSFFGVDAPNVQIVDVKALSDSLAKGEVSASPLNPQINKEFVIRLQEFAGRTADVTLSLPVSLRSAVITTLTEDGEVGKVLSVNPLRLRIGPYQTRTVKIELE